MSFNICNYNKIIGEINSFQMGYLDYYHIKIKHELLKIF
jgi:hypothetical protein